MKKNHCSKKRKKSGYGGLTGEKKDNMKWG